MDIIRVCPECGDALRYDHLDDDRVTIHWECPECGWTGTSRETEVEEVL